MKPRFLTLGLITAALSLTTAYSQFSVNPGVVINSTNAYSSAASVLGTIEWNGMKLPAIANTPFTINGQTMEIITNASGGYTVMTWGPNGTNAFTPPHDMAGAAAFVQQSLENNHPENIGFYSTNGEWDVSLGAAYAQNSGQAAAVLEAERYGIFKAAANIALGLGVLEGNQNGQNGTAAGYALFDYRHPIGDAAFVAGAFGGWDNYTGRPMGGPKAGVEYRQNRHIAGWVSVAFDFEGTFSKKPVAVANAPATDPSGLIFSGGLRYAF